MKIAKLNELSTKELRHLVAGYSSPEKYVVTKHETDDYTELNLTLIELDPPYIKRFGKDEKNEAHYFETLKEGHSLGVWDDNRLIGIAIAEYKAWNNCLWVWEFHVDPHYQGQGIGRKLMHALTKHAQEKDIRALVCETQNTNVPAIRFYRAMGFSIQSIDLSYYTNDDVEAGEVAIFMKKAISK